jgi:protein-disulfide isomerase
MKKNNIDKLLVLITSFISLLIAVVVFWIDLAHPKKIDIKNCLSFGNKDSFVTLVIFEDFKCEYCKQFSSEILPQIKSKYIDTNKISYKVMPLAFIHGSRPIANAAIAIYELKKDQFFAFLKKISQKDVKAESKEDLINIAKNLEGVNLEIFKEFLNQDIFDNYLQNNLIYAKKIMKSFQVPTIYLNGHKIKNVEKINDKIEEFISYKENK